MEKNTLGTKIAALRKQRGVTQLELAQRLGVTDKAVSKWERDLACPDIHSLPRLAQVLEITVEELIPGEEKRQEEKQPDRTALKLLVFRAVALAMGVALIVLSYLRQVDLNSGFGMVGVGLAAVAMHLFFDKKEPKER